MKKYLLLAATVLIAVCCTKPVEPAPVLPVEMSSFGFYVEDNAEVLKVDIVASEITPTIKLAFPFAFDKEALKTMKPRFEVTEGATVKVGEVELVSGETVVDFSIPVDIVVSLNENSTAVYSIECYILNGRQFDKVAESEEKFWSSISMRINPANGLPVFCATTYDSEDAAKRFPLLAKFNGSSFESAIAVSDSPVSGDPVVGVSPSGTAFVLYSEKDLSGKMSVAKVSGTSSEILGEKGALYKYNSAAKMDVLALDDNDIYLGYAVNGTSGSLTKRTLNLCHFDGSAWTQEIGAPGRDAANYGYCTQCEYKNGIGYMMVFNKNKHTLDIYKFTGSGNIEAVFNDLKVIKLADRSETLSLINLRDISFDVDSNGDIYFCVGGQFLTEEYNLGIIKYTVAQQEQDLVAVFPDANIDKSQCFDLALDSYDVPYLVTLTNDDDFPILYYLDPDTYTFKSNVLAQEPAVNIQIGFNTTNEGFISYKKANVKTTDDAGESTTTINSNIVLYQAK